MVTPSQLISQQAVQPKHNRHAKPLTPMVRYCELLLSQNTRPDARLSLKLPQPKLPLKMLLGGRRGGEAMRMKTCDFNIYIYKFSW